MQDAVWMHVLELIPDEHRGNLSAITTTGTELVIQQIFKIERNFMIVRARTAGTMDTGRTIIVAFNQIDFLAFNNKMAEEDVEKIFGGAMPEFESPAVMYQPMASAPAPMTPPRPRPASAPTPTPVAAEPVTTPAETPAAEASTQKPGQISKTILLARLRERLAEKGR